MASAVFTSARGFSSTVSATIPFPFSDSSCSREFSAHVPSHLIEGRTHYDTVDSPALRCQAEGGVGTCEGFCTHHPYTRD